MSRLVLAAAIAASAAAAAAQARLIEPAAPHIARFGACVARQMPERARELMATAVDSREERRAARRMAQGRSGCLGPRLNSLQMHTGEFRGAVAEALIEADPEAVARLRRMPPAAPVRAGAVAGRAFVAAYARCLADADVPRAAALLETAPRSPDERAALLAFGDALNDCMPLGFRYAIDTVDVRNHIAARLYEIAFPAGAIAR